MGNFLSPLVVLGDSSQRLEVVAHSLWCQIRAAVRDGAHLSMPLLTSPARYLPWGLFRRWAVNTATTGFAASHFTSLSQRDDLFEEVIGRSRGALALQHILAYTSVCLHMGASLMVVAWPDRLQLFISHRETALSGDEAETLTDMLVAELARSTARRPAYIA